MFSIFNKRETVHDGKDRLDRRAGAASSSVKKLSVSDDPTYHLDIPVDDAMRAIDARLSGLSHIEIGQAAKERGWAALHRELERHPVRPTAPALLKGTGAKTNGRVGNLQPVAARAGHSRGWRIALSSTGAVVVILAVVLGVYGAGLLNNGTGPIALDTTVSVTDVTTTEVTTPTSESTPITETTITTLPSGTTETTWVTTESSTTVTAPETTPTSGGGNTATTKATTPTTKPAVTTSTTAGPIYVSAERERDAQVMASLLAKGIVDYFAGVSDISDVSRHVAPSAQSALRWMIGRLDNPNNGQVVGDSAKHIDENTVRFTLEFVDGDKTLSFFVWVYADDEGSIITKITAAS